MKTFIKWTLLALLFQITLVIINIFSDGFDSSRMPSLIIYVSIGSLLLGGFFWLIEARYFPYRKKKLSLKITQLFGGNPISDSVLHFKFGNLDLYAEIELKLRMSKYSGGSELIKFHIPKFQVDKLRRKPSFKLKNSNCNNIPTYNIYETNGLGLKLAKRRIQSRVYPE